MQPKKLTAFFGGIVYTKFTPGQRRICFQSNLRQFQARTGEVHRTRGAQDSNPGETTKWRKPGRNTPGGGFFSVKSLSGFSYRYRSALSHRAHGFCLSELARAALTPNKNLAPAFKSLRGCGPQGQRPLPLKKPASKGGFSKKYRGRDLNP